MSTDYRAELQRLVNAYDEHGGRWPDHHEQALFQAVEDARATLAQPEPEGVTDDELVNFRNRASADCCALRSNYGAKLLSSNDLVACQAASLRAVLSRYGTPAIHPVPAMRRTLELWGTPAIQPVPVSERAPRTEDCDAEGMCWWWRESEVAWFLCDANHRDFPTWTHWLPHWALPAPAIAAELGGP